MAETDMTDNIKKNLVWLVDGNFTSSQHLRSYQDGHQLVTVHSTHAGWLHSNAPLGDQAIGIITQFHTQSHYPDTKTNQSLSYLNNAKHLVRKQQV